MTIKEKKYKGFNEIYFVLYLMAVLLLLPDGEKPKEDYIVSAQNSVYIKSWNVLLAPMFELKLLFISELLLLCVVLLELLVKLIAKSLSI